MGYRWWVRMDISNKKLQNFSGTSFCLRNFFAINYFVLLFYFYSASTSTFFFNKNYLIRFFRPIFNSDWFPETETAAFERGKKSVTTSITTFRACSIKSVLAHIEWETQVCFSNIKLRSAAATLWWNPTSCFLGWLGETFVYRAPGPMGLYQMRLHHLVGRSTGPRYSLFCFHLQEKKISLKWNMFHLG